MHHVCDFQVAVSLNVGRTGPHDDTSASLLYMNIY